MSQLPDFAVNVRRLRHARGVSQLKLAVQAGIHLVTLNNIERGLRPRDTTLQRVAEALDVPLEALLTSAVTRTNPEDPSSTVGA